MWVGGGRALPLKRVVTILDLRNTIGTKGARKIGQALQVNRALKMLHLHGCCCPDALAGENERLLEVNRVLEAKLLAVMMSMHARLGAGSGLN